MFSANVVLALFHIQKSRTFQYWTGKLLEAVPQKEPISDIYRKFPELPGTCEMPVKLTIVGSKKLRKVLKVSPRF